MKPKAKSKLKFLIPIGNTFINDLLFLFLIQFVNKPDKANNKMKKNNAGNNINQSI
ncbi:hypothetical protein ZONE111905_08170 [Zobellia nedashkovskayae]